MFNDHIENFIINFHKTEKEKFDQDFKSFYNEFLRYHKGYVNVSFPPVFFTDEFTEQLKTATEFLLDLVFSIPERIFKNDYRAMIEFQGYKTEDAEYLYKLCTPSLISQAKLSARPDFLLTHQGLKVVEMNVASAIGGIGVGDRYGEVFFRTNLAKAMYKAGINISFFPITKNWADFLYKHSRNIKDKVNPFVMIALLNESELDGDDFNSFVTYETHHFLRMNGFKVMAATLDKFDFRADGVYYKDMKVDIVIPSFIFMEARDAGVLDICDKFIENHQKGHISFYGSTVATIFDNKVNLAILSSDEFSHFFSTAEREKIAQLIPKTVKLTHKNINEIITAKDDFVLKNCISFGGHDVVIGKNNSLRDWEEVIKNAVVNKDVYIAQKLVEPRVMRQVIEPDGISNYDICVGGCFFDGFAGSFIREKINTENTTSIINCIQGAKMGIGFNT